MRNFWLRDNWLQLWLQNSGYNGYKNVTITCIVYLIVISLISHRLHLTRKTACFAGFCLLATTLATKYGMITGKKYPYKEARFTNAKRAFVVFYAYCEESQQLKRKIVFCPRSYNESAKIRWGKLTVNEINKLLETGYYFKSEDEPITIHNLGPKKEKLYEVLQSMLAIKKLEIRKKSKNTYSSILGKFKDFLKYKGWLHLEIDKIENSLAITFRDYLLEVKGNDKTTVNKNISIIGTLCNMAIERGHHFVNSFHQLKPLPEIDSTLHSAFSEEHQQILESWMKQHDPVLYVFTRFLYCAFVRPREIRQLLVSDINVAKKTITIRGTISKNGKTEIVPINPKLIECIGTLPKADNRYLFGKHLTWMGKNPISENYAYNRHLKALHACGLLNLNYTLYSWKHTGACRAIEAGVNPRKLQGLLRHSSLEETDIYLRSLGIALKNEPLKEVW